MVSEGASYSQLVQQLVHQQAGLPAALQHKGCAAHGAEVALHKKTGETLLAVGMSTGRVQGPDEWLQADVTDQVVIHFIFVEVLVVLLKLVTVATWLAEVRRWRQQSIVWWGKRWCWCFGHRRSTFRLCYLLRDTHVEGCFVGFREKVICSSVSGELHKEIYKYSVRQAAVKLLKTTKQQKYIKIQHCKNTLFKANMLHSASYLSTRTDVFSAKCNYSINFLQ